MERALRPWESYRSVLEMRIQRREALVRIRGYCLLIHSRMQCVARGAGSARRVSNALIFLLGLLVVVKLLPLSSRLVLLHVLLITKLLFLA